MFGLQRSVELERLERREDVRYLFTHVEEGK